MKPTMTEEERILTLEEKVARLQFDVYALQSKMDLMADRKTENSSEIPNNSTISKMEQVEDEPQTEEHCETCRHKDKCEGATYEYKNTEWWCLAYAPIDEPQTDCAWGKDG